MISLLFSSHNFARRSEVSGGDKMRHRVTPSYRNSILDSQYQCSGNYTSTEKCCIITAYILINLRNKKSSPSHHWRGIFYSTWKSWMRTKRNPPKEVTLRGFYASTIGAIAYGDASQYHSICSKKYGGSAFCICPTTKYASNIIGA